eukprot:scaffold132576_cov23-Tisochrysis_lutea.AAC.1
MEFIYGIQASNKKYSQGAAKSMALAVRSRLSISFICLPGPGLSRIWCIVALHCSKYNQCLLQSEYCTDSEYLRSRAYLKGVSRLASSGQGLNNDLCVALQAALKWQPMCGSSGFY